MSPARPLTRSPVHVLSGGEWAIIPVLVYLERPDSAEKFDSNAVGTRSSGAGSSAERAT